jgi:hypothetical protein
MRCHCCGIAIDAEDFYARAERHYRHGDGEAVLVVRDQEARTHTHRHGYDYSDQVAVWMAGVHRYEYGRDLSAEYQPYMNKPRIQDFVLLVELQNSGRVNYYEEWPYMHLQASLDAEHIERVCRGEEPPLDIRELRPGFR